ncbi:MAG: cobalamin biosynthesis protein CbiM [Hyphomicrobiaceae bacterium]
MRLLLFMLVLVGLPVTPANAHKLKVFATLEGQTISGYGFFIGGGRPRGAEVVIKDKSARDVYRGKTDAEGGFSFKTTGASDYTIVLNTQEGHIAKALIEADLFSTAPAPSPSAEPEPVDPGEPGGAAQASPTNGNDAGSANIQKIVEIAVAHQVRPLLEKIEALDGRLRLADIVAGVCMIIGLGGIGLWATTRASGKSK